jgi:predicted Zn-dependent protease
MSSFAKTQLYTLFMHEFGHVLGLGHSPGGQDVMYWKSCSTDAYGARQREYSQALQTRINEGFWEQFRKPALNCKVLILRLDL